MAVVVEASRVLVVGGFGTDVVDALARCGATSVLLHSAGATTDEQRRVAEEIVELPDLTDRAAVAMACAAVHERSPLSAVLSLTELGLAPAAAVAADLGLPAFHSEATARLLRDKFEMRRTLAATGQGIGFARVTTPVDAIIAADSIGYPVVVKPCSSWGGLAVRRVGSPDEVADAAEEVLYLADAVLALAIHDLAG